MPRPNEIAADARALYGPPAVRPAAGAMGDGALWVDPGNNQALYQVQSGNWVRIALPPAPLVPYVTPPPLSAWTWINQGPYDNPTDYPLLVTAENIPGGLRFQVPGPTNWPALIVASDPLPEPPYTITAFFRTGLIPEGAILGLSIRNSDSGDTNSFALYSNATSPYANTIAAAAVINTAAFSSGGLTFGSNTSIAPAQFLRIQNDGSTVRLFFSLDGLSFIELLTLDVSELGSFDQYGIYLANINEAALVGDPPYIEGYVEGVSCGRLVADLLSLEVVPELVDATMFV